MRKEEREDFPRGNTVCFSIAFTSSVLSLPREREDLFMCPTEQLMCNGDVCPRRLVDMAAIWQQAAFSCQASAHAGHSFGVHIEHPSGRAHTDSLVLKPIPNAGFPATGASWPATPLHSHPQKLASLGLKCRGQASGCANWASIQSTFMEGLLASEVLKMQKWIRSNFSLPGAHGWNLSGQEFRGHSSACPWGHCKMLFWRAWCPEKRGQVNRQRKKCKGEWKPAVE